MNKNLKRIIKSILPPVILDSLPKNKVKWFGNYSCWSNVMSECQGYDESSILAHVDAATEKVDRGESAYERDSYLFDEIQYSWPILSGILWSNSIQGRLDVADFGGALGSTYRQNKIFLQSIPHSWNVIEQKNFVKKGREKYESSTLHFYESTQECRKKTTLNTLLISSTLQYLEHPDIQLQELIDENFPVIILDRLWITKGDRHRLTRQVVPKSIYAASYPCWLLSEKIVLEHFSQKYELIESFQSFTQNEPFTDAGHSCEDKGYIFRLKNFCQK